jgi:quercetin dioxygenase-like cupin family protein
MPHDGVRSRRLDSDALTVIRYELEARATYPPHTHEHEHYLLGVAGHATAAIGDATVELAPADLIRVPAGMLHGATAGATGATFLNIGPRRPWV